MQGAGRLDTGQNAHVPLLLDKDIHSGRWPARSDYHPISRVYCQDSYDNYRLGLAGLLFEETILKNVPASDFLEASVYDNKRLFHRRLKHKKP